MESRRRQRQRKALKGTPRAGKLELRRARSLRRFRPRRWVTQVRMMAALWALPVVWPAVQQPSP